MGSAWIQKRKRKKGHSFRVLYRLGGRDFPVLYAASFNTAREASYFISRLRDEIAKGIDRFDLAPLIGATKQKEIPLLPDAATDWGAAKHNVIETTREQHRSDLARVYKVRPEFRKLRLDQITVDKAVDLLAGMIEEEYAPGTIRKSFLALSMVLQHFDMPDVTKAKQVMLPEDGQGEGHPVPLAKDVELVGLNMTEHHAIPYLVLDRCGPRVSVLMKVKLGDLDEQLKAIRVLKGAQKNKRYIYLRLGDTLWDALIASLPPKAEWDMDAPIFPDLTDARMRRAIARAASATGAMHHSPHGLRRRRGCLVYKATGSLAEAAEALGDTKRVAGEHYIYALTDYSEADYARILDRLRPEPHLKAVA